MAAGGAGSCYSPAQIQKLLFLLDREAHHLLGGPHYDFQPYNYGPFDSMVYTVLERLEFQSKAVITQGRYRTYSLTNEGQREGSAALAELSPAVQTYLQQIAAWVKSQDFSSLVSAIYQRYPEMRAKSVFVS